MAFSYVISSASGTAVMIGKTNPDPVMPAMCPMR
jgi:hypothetical protein